MENREDLGSIHPFLPLTLRSDSLCWPPAVVETLQVLSKGPDHSKVNSGEALFFTISELRDSLSLNYSAARSNSVSGGYSLFFDNLMPRDDAARWFNEVVPWMADLLLRLPCLLENHYENAVLDGVQNGLRVLGPQQPGIVLLSQESIAALLACSFFCLFPTNNRSARDLRAINFDQLFMRLYEKRDEKQQSKIKCVIHYFERICSRMPIGYVSFERKVIPLEHSPSCLSYPNADFWSKSTARLCRFEVHTSGLIEDQPYEALEVDFANKRIGGGALNRGCVQEEIRFMINQELIAGILFLPAMEKNEAIEIVGAERFSSYTGYASSFRFDGNYVDDKDVDTMGRRKTRIIAIDALRRPGKGQYELINVLREINKAFCGFLDQRKDQEYQRLFLDEEFSGSMGDQCLNHQNEIGIATGNWGCGAFGGDPEIKTMIQWLAASQALRPFLLYYTFGLESLQKLDQVVHMILSREWTVGDLWNMLVEYTSQRSKRRRETDVGFFAFLHLHHTLSAHDV